MQRSHNELVALGERVIEYSPDPTMRRQLLRSVWKIVMKYRNLEEYLPCFIVWIQFTCLHFGPNEINTLLEDLIRHVTPDQVF